MSESKKTKFLMFAPIILGLIFFFYSAISALITVQTTKIPQQSGDISMNISDYEIQQIDEKTNKVKWLLKADQAQTSSDETKAEIINPTLYFFEDAKPKFTITAARAFLDKASQEVDLREEVTLVASDHSYTIHAGQMFFSEKNDYINFSDNWTIENQAGYVIDGKEGSLKKDLQVIVSRKNAILKKDQIVLSADEIYLEPESDLAVKARTGALLELTVTNTLKANEIDIYQSGLIRARDQVAVTTETVNCYSNRLEIISNADKSPKLATFTGNPYIVQNNNSIYANVVKYDFATESASIEGNVHSGG